MVLLWISGKTHAVFIKSSKCIIPKMEEEELLSSVYNLKNISRNNSMFFEDIFFQKNKTILLFIQLLSNAIMQYHKHETRLQRICKRRNWKIRPRTEEPWRYYSEVGIWKTFPFLYHVKMSKDLWFSDIFRGYRKQTDLLFFWIF